MTEENILNKENKESNLIEITVTNDGSTHKIERGKSILEIAKNLALGSDKLPYICAKVNNALNI